MLYIKQSMEDGILRSLQSTIIYAAYNHIHKNEA